MDLNDIVVMEEDGKNEELEKLKPVDVSIEGIHRFSFFDDYFNVFYIL